MRVRSLLCLSFVAACGGTTAAPAHPRPATTPCPTGDALAAAAIAAWQHGPGTATASCGELITGGQPAWVIAGFLEQDPDAGGALSEWTAVVRPDGTPVALDGSAEVPAGFAGHALGDTWTGADLDGDGDDELIDVADAMYGGEESTHLVVWRLAAGKLVQLGESIDLASDNSGAVDPDDAEAPAPRACTGTWKLVPAGRGQHLVIDRAGPADCPTDHQVLQLTAAGLVPVP